MSMKRMTAILTALALCGALVPAAMLAHGGDDDDHGPPMNGKEKFECEIKLSPTPDAPAGAYGEAELEGKMKNGFHEGELEVEVEGLMPGTYTVRIITRTEGATFDLGTFEVSESGKHDDDDDDDCDDDGDDDDDDDGDDDDDDGDDDDEVEAEFPLPEGVLARDVATVAIISEGGATVLSGDCTETVDVMNSKFKANISVAGGSASPEARGRAVLMSKSKRGKAKQKFHLVAQFAPPNSDLMLRINGEDVMQVRSNHKGKVKIKSIPSSIAVDSILSFELVAVSDGGTALRARF